MNSMKCIIALSLALVLAGCSKPSPTTQIDPNGPVEVAIPDHGAYTGAFMDFGDAEDDVTLETIEDFEEMVGKHQAIIASSSYWGEQNFPVGQSQRHLAARLVAAGFLVAVGQAVRGRSRTGQVQFD